MNDQCRICDAEVPKRSDGSHNFKGWFVGWESWQPTQGATDLVICKDCSGDVLFYIKSCKGYKRDSWPNDIDLLCDDA